MRQAARRKQPAVGKSQELLTAAVSLSLPAINSVLYGLQYIPYIQYMKCGRNVFNMVFNTTGEYKLKGPILYDIQLASET